MQKNGTGKTRGILQPPDYSIVINPIPESRQALFAKQVSSETPAVNFSILKILASVKSNTLHVQR
jgi:hypothetical protein